MEKYFYIIAFGLPIVYGIAIALFCKWDRQMDLSHFTFLWVFASPVAIGCSGMLWYMKTGNEIQAFEMGLLFMVASICVVIISLIGALISTIKERRSKTISTGRGHAS